MKALLAVVLLSCAIYAFAQTASPIAPWVWVRGASIPTERGFSFFNWTNPGTFRLNVTVWPCFGALSLYQKIDAFPSQTSFDSSFQYKPETKIQELSAGFTGGLTGSNVTIGIQAFASYDTRAYAAKFDIVVRSDASLNDPDGYYARVPSAQSVSFAASEDKNEAYVYYVPTGNSLDSYSYWRYNTTYNQEQTGFVFGTACGVREFMEPAYPKSEEDQGSKIKVTFEVLFNQTNFEKNSFIVMVSRNCSSLGYECYEAVYDRVDVTGDSAASFLSWSISSTLLFFLLAVFLTLM